MNNENRIDFLAIGDIVTDAFIELEDAWIETDNPEKNKELCMKFGDKLPYKNVDIIAAVGNSPNAAVCAHRLGLKTALLTDVGDDFFGNEQIQTLKSNGIETKFVTQHKNLASNYHYVLRFGPERTILVKHTEFPYKFPKIEPAPRFIYLSSLGENSLPYHGEIARYLKEHPETKLAFQPGTFQMKLGKETLKDLYSLSYLFFCNKEEAQKILDTKESDIKNLLKMMKDIGPKIVIITDGPNGSYVYDGTEYWFIAMYPDPSPPVDRTGAGDSFSSTFTSAIALGKKIPEALSWGPINSMSVVQYVGAQKGLLHKDKLELLLHNAPESFAPQKI
ncbi:MAG: carbohydrate kinase family protein [Candidatus Pacebacteria bacterium]|nr:carbohydrate kinase family protein [Candidatus Paceibacterota bacterium]